MTALVDIAPNQGCRMCREQGVECGDYPNRYYQLVPGVGYVTGPGTARYGSMPHELSTKVPGGRKTKSGIDVTHDHGWMA